MSRTGFTSLKKIKEPPLRGEQYSIKERTGEVAGLEKERDDLSKEIKKLGKIFFRLGRGVDAAKITAKEITSERLQTIEYIAREVSSDLKKQASVLRNKSDRLSKTESFLIELSDYLVKYCVICEAETSLNTRRGADLDKRDGNSLKREKTAKKLKVKREEALEEAKTKLGDAKRKDALADKDLKFINNQLIKAKKKIESRDKELRLLAKKIEAKSKNMKVERRRLKKMETRLLDKEATLVRSAREVEKKAKEVEIVL